MHCVCSGQAKDAVENFIQGEERYGNMEIRSYGGKT
jgi:hypothetical protein